MARLVIRFASQLRQSGYRTTPERRFRISRSRLTVLYYAWRRQQDPSVFLADYRTGRRGVPAALLIEFIRRCSRPEPPCRKAVYEELVADWQRGKAVAGFGCWKTWCKRRRELGLRVL